MGYEHFEKLLRHTSKCYRSGLVNDTKHMNELHVVYNKANLFDETINLLKTNRLYYPEDS